MLALPNSMNIAKDAFDKYKNIENYMQMFNEEVKLYKYMPITGKLFQHYSQLLITKLGRMG